MAHFTWIGSDGKPRVTYLIGAADREAVIAKLIDAGHMAPGTAVAPDGPIAAELTAARPPSPDPMTSLEARITALEARP